MKKALIILLIIVPLILLLCAFSLNLGKLTVTIKDEENIILDRTYSIDYLPSLALFFRYGGNYQKMYENSNMGNAKTFFGSLNSEIVSDIDKIVSAYYVEKKDACVVDFCNGNFVYQDAIIGKKVDEEKIYSFLLINKNGVINLPIIIDEDVVTKNKLKLLTKKMGSFCTSYEKSTVERKRNIELALEKLDNIVIEPYANLSFNNIVGKRTVNNGFFNATVINNGEYVEGVGGGVCQVSTTLYNAWLLSSLMVEYSRCHSIPSSYVKMGFDAMVSDDTDLILTNSTPCPIYLDTYHDGKIITINLYGKKSDYDIELKNELLKSYISDEYDVIETSEEEKVILPKNGYLYRTHRIYYQNGREVKREILRTSYYPPKKGIKYVKNNANNLDKNIDNGTQ